MGDVKDKKKLLSTWDIGADFSLTERQIMGPLALGHVNWMASDGMDF